MRAELVQRQAMGRIGKPKESAALAAVDSHPPIGSCVGPVGKFIGIGLNSSGHAAESGLEARQSRSFSNGEDGC